MILRGIRRLFGTLAFLFFLVEGVSYLSMPKGSVAPSEAMNIVWGTLAIYGFGLFLAFVINGFKKPRGRIIDL